VSSSGTVAYVRAPGGSRQFEKQLVWIDQQGRSKPVGAPARDYIDYATLSPDGRHIAVRVRSGTEDLYVYDLNRDSLSRLTAGPSSSLDPVWSPDGRDIAYRNNATGTWQMYSRPVDGSAPPIGPLIASEEFDVPKSWSPDRRVLAFERTGAATQGDIWMLAFDGAPQARPFLQTPADEMQPQFSPDGRWLAYASDDQKGFQVYVTPYPGPGQRIQVSTDGGSDPQWNPKGGELFYRDGNNRTMVVKVTTGTNFSMDRPQVLYEGLEGVVTPDGQRFLSVVNPGETGAPLEINVMMNVLSNRGRVGKD
jgi:Tol biopolymer transport system component